MRLYPPAAALLSLVTALAAPSCGARSTLPGAADEGAGGTSSSISASSTSSATSATSASSATSATSASSAISASSTNSSTSASSSGSTSSSSGGPLCVPSCATGTTCGTSISGVLSTGWSFNGSAGAGAGVLTTNGNGEAGTIVYDNAIFTDSFKAVFQIQLGGGDGGSFLIETDGPNAVGQPGGGLAIAGLDGYAIEFDSYDNSDCGDPDADHVGIDVLGAVCGQGEQMSFQSFPLAPFGLNLHDGVPHTAVIVVLDGTVTLSLDGQIVIPGVALPGWTSGISYWYGFSGSTGEATAMQQVSDALVSFPTPRCL